MQSRETTVRKIYDGLSDYQELDPFEEWFSRIRILLPTRTGGIALTVDENNTEVLWIELHCPKSLPPIETCKGLLVLAATLGYKYIAAETATLHANKILKHIGLEEIEPDLFGLRLDGNTNE